MPDWAATLICPDEDFDGAPLLRREFAPRRRARSGAESATLHATAHGVFEAYLNGQPVSDEVLSPGWSSYEWRLRYRSYDVTAAAAADLGARRRAGQRLVPRAPRLGRWPRPTTATSSASSPSSRSSSTTATCRPWSPTRAGRPARRRSLANDLYDGQTIDARRESDDWLQPGFSGDGWTGVHPGELDLATLTPYIGPPVRRQEELAPVDGSGPRRPARRSSTSARTWSAGCGSGCRARPAPMVTLRHAEVLEHDELGVRPLRTAKATDQFILSGGEDVFEPTFTFHGFRYVEVEGWPGGIDALQRRTR